MNLGGSKRVNQSLSAFKLTASKSRKSQTNRQETEEGKGTSRQPSTYRGRSALKIRKEHLFEGKLFFVEVFKNQYSLIQQYQDKVTALGGKVIRYLNKQVDYVVFQEGRNKTVQKVILDSDFKDVRLVSPQFLEDCAKQSAILDPTKYLPENYEQKLQQNEVSFKVDNKKRRDISQGNSQTSSQLKSKQRVKPSGKKLPFEMDPLMIESAFEFDHEEVDKTMHEIREQHFFEKEFAKDLKKFSKMQQQALNKSREEEKQKKSVKQMNKDQLINSYIEGEIETLEFLQEMETKMKDRKLGKKRPFNGGGAANKRLTEMFKSKNVDKSEQVEDEAQNKNYLNRTGIVSIHDYLADIDKENSPINTQKPPGMNKSIHQTSLNFARRKTPLKQLIEPGADLSEPLVGAQIQKMTTYPEQKLALKEQMELPKTAHKKQLPAQNLDFSFGGAVISRRAYSLAPVFSSRSQSLKNPKILGSKLILDNKSLLIQGRNHMFTSITQSRPQTQKKRKEWDKILPQRNIPQRNCKNNVNYQEIEEESIASYDSIKKFKLDDSQFAKWVKKRRNLIDF